MTRSGRQAPQKEPRTCQRCGASFMWSSMHPKQHTCSKNCYMALHPSKPKTEAARLRRNELARQRREAAQLVKYGLTAEDYHRRRNGPCEICGRQDRVLDLDHCHDTGKFRGFLCPDCNHGLGKFRDNTALLLTAQNYLYAARARSVGA